MANNLSVGSVIEKNKIASDNVFLILIDAYILDEDGNAVTTLSFVKNSENVTYKEVEYVATSFDIDVTTENNSEPDITLTAQDQTRYLAQYIEAYGGCVDSSIRMTVVNSAALDAPAELQETFKIISSSVSSYVVTFTLGTDAAVNRRFPPYIQLKNTCTWRYRSKRCGYTGLLPTCDYSLEGDNGCKAHNNAARYGGFPGITTQAS